MSGQFIQRVINYVANEIIIKGLANSKTFQRFAVRTDHHLKKYTKAGEETLNKTLEELIQQQKAAAELAATGGGGRPVPPLRGFPGFVSAFSKEVMKDMGLLGK